MERKYIGLILTIICCCLSLPIFAQYGYSFYDSATYAQFQARQWPELVKTAKKARHHGVDYFYLQERMGFAYFEQKKYREALPILESAYRLNDGDDVLNECLYYSYIYSERYDEARCLASKVGKDFSNKLQGKIPSPINLVKATGGVKLSNNSNLGNLYFAEGGLNHIIANRFSAFHQYNYINSTGFFGKVNQQQYAVQVNLPIKKGFSIQATYHVLNYKIKGYGFPIADTSQTSMLWSLQLTKDFPYFQLFTANSYSLHLGIAHQLGINVYPLANNNLSLTAAASMITEDNYKSNAFLFKGGFSVKPFRLLRLTGTYTYNPKASDTQDYNGLLINNALDLSTHKLLTLAEIRLHAKVQLMAIYVWEYRKQEILDFNYYSNMFALGIKITP
jgi:hypothetical protein